MSRTFVTFDQLVLTIVVELYDDENDRHITDRHMFIVGQITDDPFSQERVRHARCNAVRKVMDCIDHPRFTLVSMSISTEHAASI